MEVNDNNRDGKRPKEIIINLLANGVKIDQTTVKSKKTVTELSVQKIPKYETVK